MLMADIILFTIAGRAVSLVELVSTLLGLSCVFLAGRGKVANFWLGYVYNILLFILVAQKNLYFSMALQPVSFTINAIGHYRWTHPSKDMADKRGELKISSIPTKKSIIFIVSAAALTLVLGWAMKTTSGLRPDIVAPASLPYLDAFKIIAILSAQYLSAHKKIECWYVWIVANTTNIILYILSGLFLMPLVTAVYLTLAIIGLRNWRKKMKEQ